MTEFIPPSIRARREIDNSHRSMLRVLLWARGALPKKIPATARNVHDKLICRPLSLSRRSSSELKTKRTNTHTTKVADTRSQTYAINRNMVSLEINFIFTFF